MKKKIIYAGMGLACAMALFSCKSDDHSTLSVGEIKYVTAFPQRIEPAAVPVDLGERGIGTLWFANLIDTALIIQRSPTDPVFFEAYSTNTHRHIGSFINQGRGPGEYPSPPRILNSGDSLLNLCIADTYSGKANLISFSQLIAKDTSNRYTYSPPGLPKGINKLVSMNKELKIYNHTGFTVGRTGEIQLIDYLTIYKDSTLQQQISLFDFSHRKEMPDTRILTKFISASPDLQTLFCAFSSFNQINVYSLSGKENFTICFSPDKELYTLGKVEDQSRFSFKTFYCNATCSDQYLFALYYGYGRYKMEVEKSVYPVIHVFRYDGTPVAELILKEKPQSILYDPLHNRLYGMTMEEELFYYELNNVL